jgi:hypothetical protein
VEGGREEGREEVGKERECRRWWEGGKRQREEEEVVVEEELKTLARDDTLVRVSWKRAL